MEQDGRGKDAAGRQLPGTVAASIATIEPALTALIDRMEKEAADGAFSPATASELHQIRREAEQLLQVLQQRT
jgi:hypothetical protein